DFHVTGVQTCALPICLHVADLNSSANWPLHPDLQLTLRQVRERSRQALVVVPRRGFSGAYGCNACGWQAPCPNCDLTLRFHRERSEERRVGEEGRIGW